MLVFDIQQSESAIRTLISPVCHHRALSRVPSAIQKVLISYLFYKQQCIYVNPNQKVKHKYHIFTYLCESRKIVCANSMCLTLCDPMDCSPPGFSVHGILQARALELVAISFFRGSFRHSNQTHVSCMSCIGRQILYHRATWEAPKTTIDHPKMCDHGPVSIKLYLWTLKCEFHISFI